MLGVEPITVTREAVPGTWVNGKYVPGETTTLTVMAAIQPLSPREIEMLPEGARTRARWALFCDPDQPPLQCTDLSNDTAADRVSWAGREFVVYQNGDWMAHQTGIPHYAYALLEVGADEPEVVDD